MQIRDVMPRDAQLINPGDTLQHAARLMAEGDCGVLPVADGDRLVSRAISTIRPSPPEGYE
jgi:CBS domain-containing protein